MAEEDLIFGKNRHFFGGIEPSNMLAFSVAVESGVVKVTATLPNDTVVNNQTLSSQIVVHLLPELTTMQHSLIPLRVCITETRLTV